MTRAERRQGSVRRAEILKAAATHFRRHGYAAASMRDIADAVGLLKASVYSHFDSKEQILTELLGPVLRDGLIMVEKAESATGTPIERIETFVRAHLELRIRHLDTVEIMLREYQHLPHVAAEEVVARGQFLRKLLEGHIVDGQMSGDIPADLSPRLAAGSILGLVRGLGVWYKAESSPSVEEVVEQLTRQALHGIADPRSASTLGLGSGRPVDVEPDGGAGGSDLAHGSTGGREDRHQALAEAVLVLARRLDPWSFAAGPVERSVLDAVVQRGPCTARALARLLDLPNATVQRAIDDLEYRGTLRRERDPESGRVVQISATIAGRRLAAHSKPTDLDDRLAELDPDDVRIALQVMSRIASTPEGAG